MVRHSHPLPCSQVNLDPRIVNQGTLTSMSGQDTSSSCRITELGTRSVSLVCRNYAPPPTFYEKRLTKLIAARNEPLMHLNQDSLVAPIPHVPWPGFSTR